MCELFIYCVSQNKPTIKFTQYSVKIFIDNVIYLISLIICYGKMKQKTKKKRKKKPKRGNAIQIETK